MQIRQPDESTRKPFNVSNKNPDGRLPVARKWTLVLFMGTCLLYCARMTMPVCAVSMATRFHWSKIDSGLVLGGFFWGYCFTQILGGHASDMVGGERVLLLSAASWAVITAGTPLLAHLGSHQLFLMTLARILMGLLQGVFFPSLASLCSQRVLEGERGFLMSTMNSGTYLGTLLAGGMGSVLLEQYGWESMFYCSGLLSGLWALTVWQYLLKVTPAQVKAQNHTQPGLSRKRWLKLLKKPPIWAMVFAHMCTCSTAYTLLSWLPTYFRESFPDAGVYNVVPWLTAIPSALSGGCVSDLLITRGLRRATPLLSLPITKLQTLNHSFTLVGYGVLTVRKIIGVSVNVQDLTPSCAGALYGLLLVSFSGYLIEITLSWAAVFSFIILVNAIGLWIFLIFGDAQRLDQTAHCQLVVV
uniref:Solute carrier family 17 member 9a n=1 Tax=Oryzias melastigma TaxID=30732 RepID=A0A3B3CYZ1_ORYME